MDRIKFIQSISLLGLAGVTMKLNALNQLHDSLDTTGKMPVLFLGHGSPMNAIEENEFVAGFREAGKSIPKPAAILCVSAHWETDGTYVTAMEKPRTIHDFGGFPRQLYEVQYPAPGNPELAGQTRQLVTKTDVGLDQRWGLDHGFDWALEADDKMKQFILNGDHLQLIGYKSQGKAFELAIPTPEHYLPLLYALALKENNDDIKLFNDKAIGGSLTMTSVKIG